MSQSRSLFAALLLITVFTGVAEADGRAIVPVVGSAAGVNGANFRTEMQLHNPGNGVMWGTLMFLPQALEPHTIIPATLDYEIGPKETIRFADVIASMGASGLGSLDVFPLEGGRPRIVVRAFDDQGNFGTRGLMVPVLDESEAPVLGFRFVLVAPSDLARYRFNIGVRTLGESSTMLRVVERDAAGASVGEPITLEFPGETFRQQPAAMLLGRETVAGHTYSFETLSGAAFVYATTVDNQTNDGALQLDRPVNRPPVVAGATVTTEVNEPVTIAIQATDPDDDPMTFQITAGPLHGTLSDLPVVTKTLSASEVSVIYTPATGYRGPDMFTVLVSDDVNGRTFVNIVINVGAQTGLPPNAVNDKYSMNEGETLTVNAPGVLANDTDPENNPLIAQLVQGPFSEAKFTFNADGSFVYRPKLGFSGGDFFLYKASDGGAASNVARVTIIVNSTNEPPTAVADAAATTEDSAIAINVLTNDSDPEGDPLTLVSVNSAGTLGAVTLGVGGVINYDPTGSAALQALAAAAIQTDTFSYTVRDAEFDTATATVTVTVTGVDDLPTAVADAATIAEDAPATAIDVLANDTDPDGGTKLITIVTQGTSGTVAITGGGTGLTYQPNPDFCGADSFTYTITGGSTATVTVTVTCVNDAPSFTGGADENVNEDSGTAGAHTVAGWATAISRGPTPFEDAQTLNFVIDTNDNPSLFSVAPAIDATGTLTYTLTANAFGTATITLHLHDSGGVANGGVDDSATDTLVISVASQNDNPTAVDDAATVAEDSGATAVAVLTNDDDAPDTGETLTITGVTQGTNGGAVVITGGGTGLTYQPASNFAGTDTFTYTIGDGNLGTATATVTMTVTAVNDAPANTVPGLQSVDQLMTLTFSSGNGNAISIFDVDAATPQVTVAVDNGVLSLSGTTGLTFSNGDGTGDATMTFTGLQAAINTALGGLVYDPVDTFEGTATLTLTTNDLGQTGAGGAQQDLDTVTINVTALNDPPVNSLPAAQATNEDTTLTLSTANTNKISISDPDAGAATVQVALTAANGTMTLAGTTGLSFSFTDVNGTGAGDGTGDVTMTFRGTIAAINTALDGLQFIPTANYAGAGASIQIVTNDLGNTGSGGVQSDSDTLNITVNAVNDAPAGTSNTISGNEDVSYAFTVADFGFTDPTDSPANALQAVVITTLPGAGSLTLSGGGFAAGTEISVADITAGNLAFLGAANASGSPYASFTFQVRDDGGTANGGVDLDASPNTMTINLAPVNDAPAGTNNTVSGSEDTLYTFTAAEFGFSDPNDTPANALQSVVITTLPGAGTLTLSGGGFAAGTAISLADITAGNLRFLGASNGAGSPYTTFTFQVRDDGGTANGGVDLDPTPNTMTINLTAVNDAPAGTNNSVTGVEETQYTFTAADFGFTDPNDTPANALQSVVITTLPAAGSLTLSGAGFAAGTEISLANITAGNLKFLGAANASGSPYTSFTFQVRDDGGTANGGVDLDASANTLTINLTAVNDAPVGTNNTVSGNEDTPYTFTAADFGFTDPNDTPANALQSVVITTLPGAGSLTLSGGGFAAGTEISVANISAGNLKFLGASNGAGSPYTSITFQVRDDGGTANGGVDLDPTPNTLTIDLTGVNDAPAGTDTTVTGDEDVLYTFTAANFGFTDPNDSPANALQSVVITTLPGAGSLTLSGGGFVAGTEISLASITAGNLKFLGASNAFGSPYTTFTFQVRDNGGTANGGVDLDPTPNTMTINLNPINDAPSVINENGLAGQDPAWQTVGNTELRVDMVAGTTPNVSDTTANVHPTYEGLIDNDGDVEFDPIKITAIVGCGDATAPFDCTLASGAVIHVDENGEFSFTPGPADTTDTFTYTVTDTPALGSPASTNGIVVINMLERVWYVDANAGGGGTGTSTLPFNTLDSLDEVGGAGDSDVTGDYIFVHDGSLSRTTPMEMEANQHLVGQGFGLSIPVNLNGNGSPWVGLAPGTAPQITATAGDTVTVNTAIPIEIVGLSLASNAGNAIDLTSAGALTGSATLTIGTNELRGAGAEGIDVNLNAGTTGTLTLAITNNGWNVAGTHTGNAIDVNRTAGTVNLNISNNTNILSTGAGGINVVGSAAANTIITGFASNTVHQNTIGTGVSVTAATFDTTPGGTFQTVSGGTTVVGASGNGVGTSGMVLTTVAGDLSFTDLDIFADNGAGLSASGTTPYTGSAGFQIAVGAGVATVTAIGGPAINLNTVTANTLPFQTISSTNSPTAGVALNSLLGAFSAGSGSSISGVSSAAGTSFQVGSSNATISYAGTINSTTGKGVDLTTNTGSTISFTGTMTMSSGTSNTFNATGGGTISATDTASTLTSTTGTALNVANTTIGANNLKFRSITAGTAASGPTNGIVLNTTGPSGSLIVSGAGSAGTGGTIQKTTGVGILLTSTENPQFNYMNIQNAGDDGIRGSSVNNMTLSNCTLTTNGNAAAENGLQLGEASGTIVGITGTLTMIGTTITGSAGNNVHIRNTSGTLAGMVVTNSSFNNLNDTTGANSFLFEMSGTATNSGATLTNVTFDNNSPQRALEVQAHDSANIADFVVTGSTFNNNGIHASFTQDTTSSIKFSVLSSNFQIADPLHAINVFSSSTSTSGTMRGTIEGNTIGSAGTSSSGAKGNAIRVLIQGKTQGIFKINNNTIRQVWLAGNGGRGMDLQFLGPTAGAQPITQSDITITNNDVDTMAPGTSFPLAPIYLSADDQGSPARVRAQITGNNARNSVSGSYDYPTFDGNGAFLIFQEVTAGAEGQLVDTGAASGTALSELQTANPATTATKIYESGIALIAGPINLP